MVVIIGQNTRLWEILLVSYRKVFFSLFGKRDQYPIGLSDLSDIYSSSKLATWSLRVLVSMVMRVLELEMVNTGGNRSAPFNFHSSANSPFPIGQRSDTWFLQRLLCHRAITLANSIRIAWTRYTVQGKSQFRQGNKRLKFSNCISSVQGILKTPQTISTSKAIICVGEKPKMFLLGGGRNHIHCSLNHFENIPRSKWQLKKSV